MSVDTALDRLLHHCTVVNIRGESFRLKEKRQAARATLDALLNSETAVAATRAKRSAFDQPTLVKQTAKGGTMSP
jgi:IstB-like ATP binding protein